MKWDLAARLYAAAGGYMKACFMLVSARNEHQIGSRWFSYALRTDSDSCSVSLAPF